MNKHKSIIMSAESVLASLAGKKTVTRRVVSPQPDIGSHGIHWLDKHGKVFTNQHWFEAVCSPYRAGDIVYVKEAWGHWRGDVGIAERDITTLAYRADQNQPNEIYGVPDMGWRSPLFMPKRASRLWIEITGVRVERLQEITEADALIEGGWTYAQCPVHKNPIESFALTWDALNARRGFSWESNPYVWVYEYKVTQKPEGV